MSSLNSPSNSIYSLYIACSI